MEVSPTPVDPDMFSFNEESMEITIYSGQLYSNGDYLTGLYSPGSYTVQVKAFTDDLTYTGESIVAQVDIHDPCAVSSRSWIEAPIEPLSPLKYIIGKERTYFDIQAMSGASGFKSHNEICGDVKFTAKIAYNVDSPIRGTQEALTNDLTAIVIFQEDGTFSVQTNDHELVGSHELRINASLI